MSPEQIDRVTPFCAPAMLAGGVFWFAGLTISAAFLLMLGAMAGSFDDWRTDKGLWMLATLFMTLTVLMSLTFTYFSIMDGLAGKDPDCLLAVDVFITTLVLGFNVRFLWAVAYWNRRIA